MSNKHIVRIAALLGALITVNTQAQTTVSYNFNVDATDMASALSINASAGNYFYQSTGGISNSGYFQPNGAGTDSIVNKTGLANTGSLSLSALFKTPGTVGTNGDMIGLGLYLSPTTHTSSNASFVTVIDGALSGLTANNWFLVTVNLTAGATNYTKTVTLQPYDSSGNPAGAAFDASNSGGYVIGTASLLAASTIYGGFYGGASGGAQHGAVAIDNFSFTASAIPEPSTYAATLGFAALGGVILWRRRERVRSRSTMG